MLFTTVSAGRFFFRFASGMISGGRFFALRSSGSMTPVALFASGLFLFRTAHIVFFFFSFFFFAALVLVAISFVVALFLLRSSAFLGVSFGSLFGAAAAARIALPSVGFAAHGATRVRSVSFRTSRWSAACWTFSGTSFLGGTFRGAVFTFGTIVLATFLRMGTTSFIAVGQVDAVAFGNAGRQNLAGLVETFFRFFSAILESLNETFAEGFEVFLGAIVAFESSETFGFGVAESLDEGGRTLRRRFFDGSLGGLSWSGVRSRFAVVPQFFEALDNLGGVGLGGVAGGVASWRLGDFVYPTLFHSFFVEFASLWMLSAETVSSFEMSS